MEALKQRLSALKANAAAGDGGENNIVKVTAWKAWKEAPQHQHIHHLYRQAEDRLYASARPATAFSDRLSNLS